MKSLLVLADHPGIKGWIVCRIPMIRKKRIITFYWMKSKTIHQKFIGNKYIIIRFTIDWIQQQENHNKM